MKTLYLLRHGKSNWKADYGPDHERPIAKRGRKAADRMGRFLAAHDQLPDFILCSTAVRTRQTLERAMAAGAWEVPVHHTDTLYLASLEAIHKLVRRVENQVERLLLVAHEPTCSDLVSHLVGGGDHRFPTAAMARIDLHISQWQHFGEDLGELIWLVPPRLLQQDWV